MTEIPSSTFTAYDPQSPPSKHSPAPRGNRVWIWLVVLLVFGLVFWWVYRSTNAPAAAPAGRGGFGPVTLTIAKATKGDIGVYQTAIGTVTPVFTASIVSQVTGQITAVHFREGQMVRKGDALVEIDSRPYRATLKQAEGTLERDTHLLEQGQMNLTRYQEAWAKNAIAKQQVEDQEKLVEQQQGTVKNDQGLVDFDRVQVGYCHIVSPITGRVGLRLVDQGNVVTANSGTTLAVVTQIQPITVVFTISEDNLQAVLAQLHKKQALQVEALDRSQTKTLAKGKLLTTDNLIDTTTGTVKLRAVFDNKDTALFPNQFVNTRLLVDTLKDVTLVDSSAIQHNGTQAFVWVIQDGAAQLRNVTTGVADSGLTQVTGLNPGEVVATSSFDKLQKGVKVSAAQPQGGGAPGAATDQRGGGQRSNGQGNRGQGTEGKAH